MRGVDDLDNSYYIRRITCLVVVVVAFFWLAVGDCSGLGEGRPRRNRVRVFLGDCQVGTCNSRRIMSPLT